eukprot:gene3059-5229_t
MDSLEGHELRKLIRENKYNKSTSGCSKGFIQANLVILPKEFATDFEAFCKNNHQACPVLERLNAGEYEARKICSKKNDVRTDIGKYRIYKKGELIEEVNDIQKYWRDDLVSFYIGCSFSFENKLMKGGISIRNIEEKRNVSMYKTNIECKKFGPFSCPLIVSMRPVPKERVQDAIDITAKFTETHGAPVHTGDPKDIGILDVSKVDFGDSVTIKENEVTCFWACGVTAIMSAISAKSDICITHSPGYMFVTDLKENEE